jgi:O-antigen ligase
MLEAKALKVLRNGLLVLATLTTLWMAPYSSLDPVSLPKMSVLVFLSVLLSGIWLPRITYLIQGKFQLVTALALVFTSLLILIVCFSGSGIWLQIYGTYGRNTGALTYLALILLLLSTAIATDKYFLEKILQSLVVLGVVLVIYGQFQHQGWDPLPFQNSYENNVFGTLGNPNFMSAFMGMIGVVAVGLSISRKIPKRIRAILLMLSFATLVIVYETDSLQGFLNFTAGFASLVILWLFMQQKKRAAIALSSVVGAGGGLVFLGLINVGPLANYLFKASLEARGFYWRAGVNMLIDHPLFGVGMDGYGDWYRRSRTLEDTLVSPYINSDSAHNVFLDIASNGGFPLFVTYLAILSLVVGAILRVVKRSKSFNPYFAAAVGGWVAFQAQSLISINQIGLAIWGWILSGLIIGYEISTRNEGEEETKSSNNESRRIEKQRNQVLSSTTIVSIFASTLMASVLSIPPFVAANEFYNAIKSGNALQLQPAAYIKPYDRVRFTFVASNLAQNDLNDRALIVIRDAVELFPNSYEAWNILVGLPNASPQEIARAKSEMKRLDPHNPDLK